MHKQGVHHDIMAKQGICQEYKVVSSQSSVNIIHRLLFKGENHLITS